jgi:antirestriction protein ArdC
LVPRLVAEVADQVREPWLGSWPSATGRLLVYRWRDSDPVGESAWVTEALLPNGHWTGLPNRLNRDLAHPLGVQGYAREELRAEIASLILGSEVGIGCDPGQHAGYVDHWVQILTDTPTEILYAAADAEKISDTCSGSNKNVKSAKLRRQQR